MTAQAAEATARCSERHDSPVTVRSGFGPGTVVLNPADDDDFALLLALAPFSGRVDVMSWDGQLASWIRDRLRIARHRRALAAQP